MLSPVIVFAYNRPHHLQCTLEALNRNDLAEDTKLFIFCDGAKGKEDRDKVDETRGVVKNFISVSKFKNVEISYSDVNKGLANSVISGVSRILQRCETVIVLEDDIVSAPNFLRYMNECLDYYQKDSRVGAISAYTPKFRIPPNYQHDLFLSKRGNSWGWATWKEIWEKTDWKVSDFSSFSKDRKRKKAFDATQFRAVEMLCEQMNGRIDSWAIRWDYSFFVRGLYTVYPVKTKVVNIGCDGSGTHCGNEGQKDVSLDEEPYRLEHLFENKKILRLSSENVSYVVKLFREMRCRMSGLKIWFLERNLSK